MFIPILAALVPSLIGVAEKLISKPKSGDEKKDLVMNILGSVYDRFLAGFIPDLPNIDEREMFLQIASQLVDRLVSEMFKK